MVWLRPACRVWPAGLAARSCCRCVGADGVGGASAPAAARGLRLLRLFVPRWSQALPSVSEGEDEGSQLPPEPAAFALQGGGRDVFWGRQACGVLQSIAVLSVLHQG